MSGQTSRERERERQLLPPHQWSIGSSGDTRAEGDEQKETLTHDREVGGGGDGPSSPEVDATLVESVVLLDEGRDPQDSSCRRRQVKGDPLTDARRWDPRSGSEGTSACVDRQHRSSTHVFLVPEDQSHEVLALPTTHSLTQVAGDQRR